MIDPEAKRKELAFLLGTLEGNFACLSQAIDGLPESAMKIQLQGFYEDSVDELAILSTMCEDPQPR